MEQDCPWKTHTLDNLGTYKEKAPVIASREHMNLSVAGTLTNTEHALIRAEGKPDHRRTIR